MMRLRFLVPVLGFASLSLFAVACTEGGDSGGEGGAGGEASPPTPGDAGAGGAGGAGGACASDGSGTLVIEVTGLPAGVAPDISIAGPDALNATEDGPIEDVASGEYVVTADRVFDADPLVRTVFEAKVTTKAFCLADGGSQTIQVDYSAIPSSNKLWLTSGKADELVGYSSAAIAETGITDASVAVDTIGGVALAFDRDGNLWTVNPTIGEETLVRIPASALGESGTREPDVRIKVTDIECFPALTGLAFDGSGNLWLSACEDRIFRLNAADLKTSGDKTADVLLTEVINNQGIAFDKDGNLWVAGGPTVERFDAARLELSDTDPADLEISVVGATANDNTVLGAEQLAFDKAGNLWGVSGTTVFQLAVDDLDGSGTHEIKSNVSFPIDVAALPASIAFDDSNGLWLDLADREFGRFSPAQLGTSVVPGTAVAPSVLITSESITSTLPVIFFPAPAGLPLYHSLPVE